MRYPKSVKSKALLRIRRGEHISHIAYKLGVPDHTLRRWANGARIRLRLGMKVGYIPVLAPAPTSAHGSEVLAAIDLLLESAQQLRRQLTIGA